MKITGMKDYVIAIGEVIEKWYPHLDWETIMEVATSDNEVSRKAEAEVKKMMRSDV